MMITMVGRYSNILRAPLIFRCTLEKVKFYCIEIFKSVLVFVPYLILMDYPDQVPANDEVGTSFIAL